MTAGLYPFEFSIGGTPLSLQAKNRAHLATWKDSVRAAALERRDDVAPGCFLDDVRLAATIFYFTPAPLQGDVDNIVKPILDALVGVAYIDDQALERVIVQKFEPDTGATFSSPSEQLAAALDAHRPRVYVRVDDDLSWRNVT